MSNATKMYKIPTNCENLLRAKKRKQIKKPASNTPYYPTLTKITYDPRSIQKQQTQNIIATILNNLKEKQFEDKQIADFFFSVGTTKEEKDKVREWQEKNKKEWQYASTIKPNFDSSVLSNIDFPSVPPPAAVAVDGDRPPSDWYRDDNNELRLDRLDLEMDRLNSTSLLDDDIRIKGLDMGFDKELFENRAINQFKLVYMGSTLNTFVVKSKNTKYYPELRLYVNPENEEQFYQLYSFNTNEDFLSSLIDFARFAIVKYEDAIESRGDPDQTARYIVKRNFLDALIKYYEQLREVNIGIIDTGYAEPGEHWFQRQPLSEYQRDIIQSLIGDIPRDAEGRPLSADDLEPAGLVQRRPNVADLELDESDLT